MRAALVALLAVLALPAQEEADFYEIETLRFDETQPLEVSALACLADGTLLVATRLGDVFAIADPYADDFVDVALVRWARGLAQPLGLLEHDGWIWTAQRGELTRMRDRDGNGRADEFETVCDDWEISGNYHEYAFGPRLDREGRMWVTLNKPFGREPYGRAHWRGWAVRVDPGTRVMTPMCTGLRSPAGVETSPWGDVFYTDNQGEWCNASKLALLEPGSFHGHPWGLHSRELAGEPFASIPDPVSGTPMAEVPRLAMPAVWFPYDKAGKSPCGMRWDTTGGAFGPFAGQLFVTDQHHASVLRVDLENVSGHWQGAVFRFREGLPCGATRVAFGRDGSLFVGMTNAGWASKGTRPWGLSRMRWTGRVPFEIRTMRAREHGFELRFTKPVDPALARDPRRFRFESYTYLLESRYGGPEHDKLALEVLRAEVSDDGYSVRLAVDPLRSGFVHELRIDDLRAADGEPLLHPEAYYTLVRRP